MTAKRRFVGRAPGRLDLMGGNGNYSGGLVFEATTAEGTWATVELREDRQILFFNPQVRDFGWEDEVEFSLDDLSSDERVRQLVKRRRGSAGRLTFWERSSCLRSGSRTASREAPTFISNPKCRCGRARARRRRWRWR